MDDGRFDELYHVDHQPVPFVLKLLLLVCLVLCLVGVVGIVAAGLAARSGPLWVTILVPISVGASGMAVFVMLGGLRTRVTARHVAIQYGYWPWAKTLRLEDIAHCRAVTYNPLRTFGGWGIKKSRSGIWAYTVGGNRGLLIVMADGRKFLVGSDDPEATADAVALSGVPVLPAAELETLTL